MSEQNAWEKTLCGRLKGGETEDISFAPLADWLLGPVRMALLETHLDLQVADVLAETGDPKAIAAQLGVDPGNLSFFLDALVTIGLATKSDGHYANSPLAAKYLRRDSETYLGGLIRHLQGMQHRNLPKLKELLISGPPPVREEHRLDDPLHWKRSAKDLACYQKAGIARLAAELVASLPEWPALRHMLDLGGGPGVIGLFIVQSHPSMTGALCDLPPVVEVAREEIAASGMAHRMTLYPGNYNEIPFGSGYDLIWASHTLYFAKDLRALMGKLLDALQPGGIFISFHEGLTHERTQPPPYVLSRLSLALEGQDTTFQAGQIAEAALAAGFAELETRAVDTPMGQVRVDILRKAGSLRGRCP